MASNASWNPFVTTNVAGSFSIQSEGFVQGVALDDPTVRFALAGGPLAGTETLPMWGGVAISEFIPASAASGAFAGLGSQIARATAIGGGNPISGFSVLNQASSWVTSPQSECPSASAYQTIPYYRLGSGARIALAIDPSLVSLDGGLTSQQVSWDYNAQCLAPYVASGGTVAVTSVTGAYAAGVWTFVVVAGAATQVGAVGDYITFSGITGTGANYLNSTHVVSAYTDNEHFSFQVSGGSTLFSSGAQSGTILVQQGVGALAVKILKLNIGNSKVVTYDAVNNLVHWTNNGSTAIALI
jgi:hypothetical protein